MVFLPFASNTSPLDAVTLRVPGNQGNWWHALVGAPFFLAFPMIWVRLGSLAAKQTSTLVGRRFIWILVALSICATVAVETPFLLHLAGTSEWQRFGILCLGFGIVIASGVGLLLRRRFIPPIRACLVGLSAAYLANAALCLVVYSNAEGPLTSRSGWLITIDDCVAYGPRSWLDIQAERSGKICTFGVCVMISADYAQTGSWPEFFSGIVRFWKQSLPPPLDANKLVAGVTIYWPLQ